MNIGINLHSIEIISTSDEKTWLLLKSFVGEFTYENNGLVVLGSLSKPLILVNTNLDEVS